MANPKLNSDETVTLICNALNHVQAQYGRDRITEEMVRSIRALEPEPASKGHIQFTTKKRTKRKRVDGTYQSVDEPKRDTLKTGRFFSRKLTCLWDYMNGKAIEEATCNINFTMWPDLSVDMLEGKDVEQAYADGVGHSTCMTGRDRIKYIQMFVKNPTIVKMLVISNCGQSGRAMVWKLDDGRFFMDRIYSSGSEIRQKLYDHAASKCWLFRKYTDAANTTIMIPADKKGKKYKEMKDIEYKKISISNLKWSPGGVPYMDTFKLGCIPDPEKDELQLLHKHGRSSHKTFNLQSTGGRTDADKQCNECSKRSHITHVVHYTIDRDKVDLCGECGKTTIRGCMCCDRYKYLKGNEYLAATGYCNKCFPKNYSLCSSCNDPIRKTSDGHKVRFCTKCEAKQSKAIKTEITKRRSKGQEISLFYVTRTGTESTLVCPQYMTGVGESEPDME